MAGLDIYTFSPIYICNHQQNQTKREVSELQESAGPMRIFQSPFSMNDKSITAAQPSASIQER